MPKSRASNLSRYVPGISAEWDLDAPGSRWQRRIGTLVFVDISGFTNLSERLAQKGRIGAEELTGVLNRVFGQMLNVASDRGGSLLKFGGDSLLLFFESEDHVLQATAATVEMRSALRDASIEPTSVGRIHLKMSSGIHAGSVDFFLVGNSHRDLIVSGPAATTTNEMEGAAGAGEIVVSSAVKERLPKEFTGDAKGNGWLIRKRKIHHPPCGPHRPRVVSADVYDTRVPQALREQLTSGLTEPEHRIATIGFVKFQGIDELLEKDGPERVGDQLDRLITTIQEAADDEGVTFLATDVDTDGGKVILAAGVPSSRHDDEGRVLRTARRMLDADIGLSVRIGVNRGHVFSGNVGTALRSTYTVMGDTVNLAARLMAAAPSGGLYASPAVLDRSSTLFSTAALEPFHVKGKDRPVQAYQAFEETGTRTIETSRDLPFKGRDTERDLIVTIVSTSGESGRGGMMTITGDTGVGKSRLIAEVLELCPGLDTMMVQAEPNGTDNPYWAFRDPLRRALGIERGSQPEMTDSFLKAIRRVAPDLEHSAPLLGDVIHIEVPDNEETAAIDPQFRPDRTADALIELIERLYSGPFAIVAEDGHWMDDASIQLLRNIGDAAETRPWTVIFTARNQDTDFEPLGEETALRPLTDAVIKEIAIEATSAAPLRPHELEELINRVDGNPLFLEQTLGLIRETGSAENLPDSLAAVASSDIDTLAPLSRQLLRYSSVLGRSFNRELLNMYLAPEEVALDDATRKDLDRFLVADGDRLKFRHAVVHDAAYQGLSFGRRRELHRRAGDLIENLAEDREAPAEFLANQYSLAAVYDKAWHYSNLAADRAKAAYANTEAAAHYIRAIEAARQTTTATPKEVSTVWIDLGVVQELSGQMERARASFGQALKATQLNNLERAGVNLKRAGTWMETGNLSQAKRNVTRGRRLAESSESPKASGVLAQIDAFEASVHATNNDPIRAATCASSSIYRAMSSGETEALARSYVVLDWANFMMGVKEERKSPAAIEIYRSLGLHERSSVAMINLGGFAYLEGEWAEAINWYRQAVDASELSGNILDAALAQTNIAELLITQRRYDEGAPLLEEALRVFTSTQSDVFIPLVKLQLGRQAIGDGDFEEGLELLRSLIDDQLSGDDTPWTAETALAYAEGLASAGRLDQALQTISDLQTRHPETASEVSIGLERLTGLCKAGLGDFEGGLATLVEALKEATETGDLLEEALVSQAKIDIASAAHRQPNPSDTSRAKELFERLGIKT